MRRFSVISLCVLNACIAAGLLWYVFGNKPKRPDIPQKPAAERLSGAERWNRAKAARSSREAFFELSQSEDARALQERTTQEIGKLFSEIQPDLNRWPFFQAVIQNHGRNASDEEALSLLARVASETEQPLTLRDTAFRSYVENTLRLKKAVDANDPAFILIDTLSKENNSLSGTALQAEHFLAGKGTTGEVRATLFEERLRAVLLDTGCPGPVRITALQILSENDAVEDLPISALYKDAGVRLQTALLNSLNTTDVTEQTKLWLEAVEAVTPEQEQLRIKILGQ